MTETTAINLPQVVAEVIAAFEEYERALVDNELSTLDAYFWEAPHTVRYGVAENLYGADAIAVYRRSCRPVGHGRRLHNTVITTFGKDYATVSTEFEDGETPRIGRQMQTWVRFPNGWKVVSAHVSIDLSTLEY
ncbi:oxalurate catabolism protein HpxZ [Vreelandella sp. EE27]